MSEADEVNPADSQFPSVADRMREDWNARAREDAYYYVAFGQRGQDDTEFYHSGADIVRSLEAELKRLQPADHKSRRALEIGCGPGRLMLPMSWNFGEIHGVDISDEMISRATWALHDIPNAFPRVTRGTDLKMFGDEMFDFIYSYAVFQHIPSAEVVFSYLAECRRVLKAQGILRCQINGLPKTAKEYTTWEGARIGAGEMADFACMHDMQLLAIEGVDTQYFWLTMRKQPAGWFESLASNPPKETCRVRNIYNAQTGEAAVPASGRYANIAIWIEDFPQDADLNQINLLIEGKEAAPVYIGPPVSDGLTQVNVILPKHVRTGLVPVELQRFGQTIAETAWMRVIPPGPVVPKIVRVTDGIDQVLEWRTKTRTVKLSFEDLANPEFTAATIDGFPVADLETFCTNPVNSAHEVNFTLPSQTRAGAHELEVSIGKRKFPAMTIEVLA